VSWISDESRQDSPMSRIPANVHQIENEVNLFNERLELETEGYVVNGEKEWIRGWRRWDGEWMSRPVGV